MQHRGVADDDHLVDPIAIYAGRFVELGEDAVHGPLNRLAQLCLRFVTLHPMADARDDVGTKGRLSVECRPHRLRHSGAEVHQGSDHRRRAQVEGNAVALLAGIAGLDRDQLVAPEHRRDFELGGPQDGRQRPQHPEIRFHVETLGGQRIAQSFDVTPLVFETRLGQLDEHLAHVRIQQHQTVDAHGGGLRDPQQLRHRNRRVLVDLCLAGESPAGLQFAGAQLLPVGRRDLRATLEDLHLALAAGAAPATGRVDRQPDPVRRAEERRARGNARGLIERLVADLELLLDHAGVAGSTAAAFFWS